MDGGDIIRLIFILGLIVLAWTLMYLQSRARRKNLRKLAAALGGRMAGKWFIDYAIIETQGIKARIKVRSKWPRRLVPSQLRLEVIASPKFWWTIQRKKRLNLALSFEGLCKMETPSLLGPGLQIGASDPSAAATYFAEPRNQAAILEFFKRGYIELLAGNGLIVAVKNNYDTNDLAPELVRGQLKALHQLATS